MISWLIIKLFNNSTSTAVAYSVEWTVCRFRTCEDATVARFKRAVFIFTWSVINWVAGHLTTLLQLRRFYSVGCTHADRRRRPWGISVLKFVRDTDRNCEKLVKTASNVTEIRTRCRLNLFPLFPLLSGQGAAQWLLNTVQPGYKNVYLCDTSLIESDILWFQLIRHS
jgi:hypothetical protein